MQFIDTFAVAGTRRREDGYLVADTRIARTGIQLYRGVEVGKPEMDVVRVYRSPEEVFADAALRSAAHVPVTNGHPPEMVTADNWTKYARGQTGDEVRTEGHFVRVPLMVADAAAIADIEGGKREWSCGYLCDLVFEPGVSPDGETFDAQQKNIRINHVALEARGRAGSEVRIGDGAANWGVSPIHLADEKDRIMPDNNLRSVLVDGLSVSCTDQGFQAIAKLIAERDAARKATTDAATEHKTALDAAIAKAAADLAKKDAEIDDLKGKVLDGAALDKLVADRAGLIATAKAIAPDVKTEGLTDADIRKAVVVAKVGDASIKDKPAAYIDARFDILAEAAGKTTADPVRDALLTPQQVADADKAVLDARAEYLASLNGEPAKAA